MANPSTWCPLKVNIGGGDSSFLTYVDIIFESFTAFSGRVKSQMCTLPFSDHVAATCFSPIVVA